MTKNRLVTLLLLILIPTACKGQYYSDAPIAKAGEPEEVSIASSSELDTVLINFSDSEIAWKGTKMWGRGMHTGVVPIKEGYLLYMGERLVGGTAIADMTSIGITDIPPEDRAPIRNLTEHLEDEVFFDVANYPEASFTFTSIEYSSENLLTIRGNLMIKGVTKHITVSASVDSTGNAFTSRFRINRFDWNVAFRGGFDSTSFAARNLVDKYIELKITLIMKK